MNSPHPETAMPLRCYPVAMLLLLGAMACAKEVPAPPTLASYTAYIEALVAALA